MDLMCQILKSHAGRDKCLRTVNYTCMLLSGVPNAVLSKKFLTLASEMSKCRTILRLFDDVVMLNYSISYGLGKQETDVVLRWLGVFNNIVDQLYYPIEHIAWAADKQLINIQSGLWWQSGTILWTISLYLGIVRSLRYIQILKQREKALAKEKFSTADFKEIDFEFLTIAQNCFDLCNAIHWLPKGILWSQQLKPWQVGFFGLLSTIPSFYKFLLTM